MSTESRLYERLGVQGRVASTTLSSATSAATSIPTDSVDMRVADKALAVVQVGSDSDNTCTAYVDYGSAAYNTAGSATAFAWTQYNTAATATGGSGEVIGIEVNSTDLPTTHPYMRIRVTSTLANDDELTVSGLIVTSNNRYETVDTLLDSVTEVD
jgi:hypothetical protein